MAITVEELEAFVRRLENDLSKIIDDRLVDFERLTGISVSGITVPMIEVTTIDSLYRRFRTGKVCVDVKI